jgi:hypothetical protein
LAFGGYTWGVVRRPLLVLLVLLGLFASACGETPGDVLPNPRDGRSGIQLSGRIGDRPISISDGLPTLNTADCDLPDGPDRDVCIVTRDINGDQLVIVFENPDVLEEGAVLPVGPGDCDEPAACDDVTDVAIVELRYRTDEPVRAQSGQLRVDVVEPGQRYRGDLRLRLPDGSNLTATFDLVPRPDEIS